MVMVISLILALLMLDLMAEDKSTFYTIAVQYGIMFIVNSALFCDVIMSNNEKMCPTLTVWTVVYTTSIVINLVAIVTRINFWIPIASQTAAKYIIHNMNIKPGGSTIDLQSVSLLTSIFLGLILAFAFLATVFLENNEPEEIDVHLPDQPPRYTLVDRPPNYNNEGYLHELNITEQTRRIQRT
jgi:hypothetical protein